MARDYKGNPITQEQIEGLDRFNSNQVQNKLCYNVSSILKFEVDKSYAYEHEEDADIYSKLLPSPMRDISFIPSEGEVILFTKQHAGDVVGNERSILKNFQVTRVEKVISQDVPAFRLFITAYVVPVENAVRFELWRKGE